MSISNLEQHVIFWARQREIFIGSTPDRQMVKTREEVKELADAILMERVDLIEDAIGDIMVTLIIQAHFWGLDLEQCLYAAYQEIKDRRGRMVNGVFVKEADLED